MLGTGKMDLRALKRIAVERLTGRKVLEIQTLHTTPDIQQKVSAQTQRWKVMKRR